ncbi:MAG: hypothetical protein ACR2HY_02360 [Acidimicrobiales bacterium]
MSGDPRLERLLRWYPRSWRERHGAELVAHLQDSLGGRRPSSRERLDVARGGVVECLHASGLAGGEREAPDRARSGALLVLAAWAVFVVAGSGLAKLSEHWEASRPPASVGCPPQRSPPSR